MKPSTTTVVEQYPDSTTVFLVEVEEKIFKRLTELSAKEGVSLKMLASEMLKTFLTLHHRELRQLIEILKKRSRRG